RGAAQERRPSWARLANPRVGSGRAECLRELLPGVPPRKGLREVQHDASHRALGPYGDLQQALAQRPDLRRADGRAAGEALQDLEQRSEEHTSELQSPDHLVCRLLLEKKKNTNVIH